MPSKDSGSPDGDTTEFTKVISGLLESQNTELKKIANYLSPDQEEQRYRRLTRALIRATSIVAIGICESTKLNNFSAFASSSNLSIK